MTGPVTSRRTVVVASAAGLGALLTGCGSDDGGDGGEGERLAATSDIPEGGGMVFEEQQVVVTQPEAGRFRGFSAVCTHQGCTVAQVRDGTIDCLCHGSKFAIADGAVVRGPAERPLPEEAITVRGDTIRLG